MRIKNTLNLISMTVCTLLLGLPINSPVEGQEPVSKEYNFEIIPSDEPEQIADIALKTGELQKRRALIFKAQGGKILRGVHPKSHGCVVADFTINQDIASTLQVGLFSNPGKQYKALVRFSNASVRLSPDLEGGANSSRGMAIKVFDVGGETLISDKGNNNQDFLMINTPSFAFPNVRSYQRLTNALLKSSSGTDPRGAFVPAPDWIKEDFINLKKTGEVLVQIATRTVRNPLEVQYFAAAPSSFGVNKIMKYSADSCGGKKVQEPFENPSLGEATNNYLHEALAFTMSKEKNVCFDLKIQVLSAEQVKAHRDLDPIISRGDLVEDASKVWNEEEIPFVNVAKLILRGPQKIDLSDKVQKDCESQAFNPWHSLTLHKPLGGINRLRQPVYIISDSKRQ